VLDACRKEYFLLESKLKKALTSVEAKEREMSRRNDEMQILFDKKSADLDLKEKMFRKETQYKLDSEVREELKSNCIDHYTRVDQPTNCALNCYET